MNWWMHDKGRSMKRSGRLGICLYSSMVDCPSNSRAAEGGRLDAPAGRDRHHRPLAMEVLGKRPCLLRLTKGEDGPPGAVPLQELTLRGYSDGGLGIPPLPGPFPDRLLTRGRV